MPSLASQLLVSTQNDSSSPSPCHGPFFQVPEGARVRANALAEAQPCPTQGLQKADGLRRGWEGNIPAKLLKGKARHPTKKCWSQTSSTPSACYLQLSLQQRCWGKSPE